MLITVEGPAISAPSRVAIASNLAGVVDALIPGYGGRPLRVRPLDRHRFACGIAGALQAAFTRRAIDSGKVTWAEMTDEEVYRLDRPKHVHDGGEPWKHSGLPLVLVRPRAEIWEPPRGSVLVIDPSTDTTLVSSLMAGGAIADISCWAEDGTEGEIAWLQAGK